MGRCLFLFLLLLSATTALAVAPNCGPVGLKLEEYVTLFRQEELPAKLRADQLAQLSQDEREMREQRLHAEQLACEEQNARYARGESSWWSALTRFAASTPAEIAQFTGHGRRPAQVRTPPPPPPPPPPLRATSPAALEAELRALPAEVDWRKKGVVTPPKDQGGCGSCWTFGAVESIESAWAIATGNLLVLSEQQIVDCCPNPDGCGGTGGCEGGTAQIVYDYVVKIGGIESEKSYPYEGRDDKCRYKNASRSPVQLSGYLQLPPNNYSAMMTAIATIAPILCCVGFFKKG